MTHKPRIYLAGPDLFYPDAGQRYARLKVMCAQHGLQGIAPTDGAPTTLSCSPDANGARLLYRHDIDLLQTCDGVLANISPYGGPLDADSGTAYEMGYAAACGLPVVAYCTDGLTTRERTLQAGRLIDASGRDDEGLLVEDFGLSANLMLCAEHPTFPTPDLAAEHLASTLQEFAPRVAPKDEQTIVRQDLVALVTRLARELRRATAADGRPSSSLPDRAMDYLRRKGLLGSPLRGDNAEDSVATALEPEGPR